MAVSFLLTASPTFPAGSSVGIYALLSFAGGPPKAGLPPLAPRLQLVTVEAPGRTTVAGLEAETAYVAGAEVQGSWRYVTFTTGAEAPGSGAGGLSLAEVEALIDSAEPVPPVTRATSFTIAPSDLATCQNMTKGVGEQSCRVPAQASLGASPFPHGFWVLLANRGGAKMVVLFDEGVAAHPAKGEYVIPAESVATLRLELDDSWAVVGCE